MQKAPTKNAPSRGRPSFQIDGERLRKIRQSKGFTQAQLMRLVKAQMYEKPTNSSEETLKNSYRRWEKTGKLSQKNAEALAKVLEVTVATLQGGEPPATQSRLQAFEARVQERLKAGITALQNLLNAEASKATPRRHLSLDGGPPHEPGSQAEDQANLRYVAEKLTRKLEHAQLSQDQKVLTELSNLLGYTLHELQQPASIDGLWLLLQDGICADQPRFFQGVSGLTWAVREAVENLLKNSPCDSRITLEQEGPWLRLKVFPRYLAENHELRPQLSFVRGQASATGIQWTQPSWRDDFWLKTLESDLCQYSNYVIGLDSKEKGPTKLSALKLAIYKRPTRAEFEKAGWDAQNQLVTVTGNWLEQTRQRNHAEGTWSENETSEYLEDLEKVLERFSEVGEAHDWVTRRLCSHLLYVMQPLLNEWPLRYWKFESSDECIAVQLDAPFWLAHQRQNFDCIGTKYLVFLVERPPQQEIRRVPWRRASITQAVTEVQRIYEAELAPIEFGPPLPRDLIAQSL